VLVKTGAAVDRQNPVAGATLSVATQDAFQRGLLIGIPNRLAHYCHSAFSSSPFSCLSTSERVNSLSALSTIAVRSSAVISGLYLPEFSG